MFREAILAVQTQIVESAEAVGRAPTDVKLLLAVKSRSGAQCVAAAQSLAALGLSVRLGHNRVQEMVQTGAELRAAGFGPDTMHLIGPLQKNKINSALNWARTIETIDSLTLAQAISLRAVRDETPLEVLVEVNTSGEITKHGCSLESAAEVAFQVAQLPQLRLRGFMTVGANSPDEIVVRKSYAALRQLRDQVLSSSAAETGEATELSMGMSQDLGWAIVEGATQVRIGTAVFGSRP